MLVIVPVLTFFLLFLFFHQPLDKKNDRLTTCRGALISASIAWGILLTEILSLFRVITLDRLLVSWALSGTTVMGILIVRYRKGQPVPRLPRTQISSFERWLLRSIAVIALALSLTAWKAPPNNWDSMTYHMSRVVHWIQNQSVNHYPTHIQRQLHSNPWSEFAITHFQLLANGDRFANFIQLFSMIGSIVGVTLIAKLLGANGRGEVFSAVIAFTIPMGILQASSTQNDYVVAYWLVCLVYLTLQYQSSRDMRLVWEIGCSLGLSILTKATAYLFAFPFMVWFGIWGFATHRIKFLKPFFTVLILAFAVNFCHYGRNLDLYDHPLASPEHRKKATNEIFSASSIFSGVIRNSGLHLGTPFNRANAAFDKGIRKIHQLFRIEVNDPRTTFLSTKFFVPFSFHEDQAGNSLHLFLILTSILLYLGSRKKMPLKQLNYYIMAVIVAYLLSCFYIKWTPWNSRYHLPLFVLSSPFVAIVLTRSMDYRIANSIVVLLMLSSLPWVLWNSSRSLIGFRSIFPDRRIDQYFRNRPYLKNPYLLATDYVKSRGCTNIGLLGSENFWEYPFWILLKQNSGQPVRIEHISVKNVSSQKADMFHRNDDIPCAIISVGLEQSTTLRINNMVFDKSFERDQVIVFTRTI
jgi:hypothetical protein